MTKDIDLSEKLRREKLRRAKIRFAHFEMVLDLSLLIGAVTMLLYLYIIVMKF